MGRITEPGVKPVITIHDSLEHGYPHCHVGTADVKVFVFKEGIVSEKQVLTKDLKFIYSYYNDMIAKFAELSWDVENCPNEYRDQLYPKPE